MQRHRFQQPDIKNSPPIISMKACLPAAAYGTHCVESRWSRRRQRRYHQHRQGGSNKEFTAMIRESKFGEASQRVVVEDFCPY
jgi:hypothetical protein